jgi:hypothetical protein
MQEQEARNPFQRKYALWKERLLDLTAGNRLLNFRATKVSSVRLTSPSLNEIFDRLVVRELSLRFRYTEAALSSSLRRTP